MAITPIRRLTPTLPQTKRAPANMARSTPIAQATQRNATEYRKKFSVLHLAGVGVIMTRTREPFRAISTLQEFAFAEKKKFKVWTIAHGWETRKPTSGDTPPDYDGIADPVLALRALTAGGAPDTFDEGIFVMMYPHKPLSTNIVMVQLIKEYAKSFPETAKRLILVAPLGFTLPQELEDDITILDFDAPSHEELNESYREVIASLSSAKRPLFSDKDIERLLSAGGGMTTHEFENAIARAFVEMRETLPNAPIDDVAAMVMRVKTEVVKRSEVLEVMPSDRIENIGGLENLKSWVTKRANCFGPEAKAFGVEPPKGIALIGVPGAGKTACAKAISSVLGLVLIKFDVGKVFNSLVGESEKRVHAALKMVESMAPAVLLIDEVDKAFASQSTGSGDSGVGSRVLGAILTWMQETKAPVFMVVTANRTKNLPSEFLRKGRLDEVFSVTLPHEGERLAVLEIHLRKRGQDPANIPDLQLAVARSAGYVSAELEGAVKDSIIEAFSRNIPVSGALIAEQLGNTVPLSEAFKEDFDAMRVWAEQNARPASLLPGAVTEAPRVRNRPAVAGTKGRFGSMDSVN